MPDDREPHARGSRPGSGEDPGVRSEYGAAPEGPLPEFSGSESPAAPTSGVNDAPAAAGAEERALFEWGGGYVGGRGYAGTNYDLEHGYALGHDPLAPRPPASAARRGRAAGSGRGPAWGEPDPYDEYGPARYGYGPYHDRLRRRRRSDEEIRKEVEDALFFDTWVDADAISVSVEAAVVTLSGILPSFEELRYAVDDAWDVDGVRGVRSELDVDESAARRRGRGVSDRAGGMPGEAPSVRVGADERDARALGDARTSDPEWRSQLHGHPDAGTDRAGPAAAAPRPGSARGRGRRRAPETSTGADGEARPRRGNRGTRAGRGSGTGAVGQSGRGRGAHARGAVSESPGERGGGAGAGEAMEGGAGRPE